MRRTNVSQFRTTFTAMMEPVEILRGTETVGFYYPKGTEPRGVVDERGQEPLPPNDKPRTFNVPKPRAKLPDLTKKA